MSDRNLGQKPARGGLFGTYLSVMLGIFVSKLLGFLRDVIFAWKMGANAETDIYFGIFGVVTLVFTGVGVASSTLVIKNLNRASNAGENGESARREYVSAFIMRASVCLIVITAALYAAAPQLTSLLLPGLDGEMRALALRVTYIMLPSLFFVVIAYIISGVLQNSRVFFIPSIVSLPYNVILISQLLFTDPDITAVSAVTTVGWGLHIVFQLPSFYRSGYRFFYRGAGKAKVRGIGETAAIFFSNMAFQLCFLIDRGLVSGIGGAVTSVNYASNLFVTVSGVFVVAMSNVMFPAISKNFEEGKLDYVRRMIGSIINVMTVIFVPFLLTALFFGGDIVSLIWERGMFTSEASAMTASAFVIYSFGIFGYIAEELFSKALYLSSKYAPTVAAVAVVVALKLLTGRAAADKFGVIGTALATTVTLTLYGIFITVSVRRAIGPFFTRRLACSAGRVLLSGALSVCAYFIARAAAPSLFSGRAGFLVPLVICGAVYAVSLILTGALRAAVDDMKCVRDTEG